VLPPLPEQDIDIAVPLSPSEPKLAVTDSIVFNVMDADFQRSADAV